jgi:hypothetical protein
MAASFVAAELLGPVTGGACCGSSAMQRQLAERGGLQRQLLQLLLLGMRDAAEQLRATATATKANTNLACALASNVLSALNCNTALHAALQAELRGPGSRQLLQDAAALVQALPVRLGGGLEDADGSRALVQGIALPVTLWQLMAPDLEQAQQAQRRSAGREVGLSPDDAVLWVVQQMSSAMAGMRLAAAAAASVLPRRNEHTLIVGASNWANLLSKLEPYVGTAAQLAAWTAALDSGLRLAPVLADLELRWRQLSLPLPGMAEGARNMSNSIALLWMAYLPAALTYVSRQFAADLLWCCGLMTVRMRQPCGPATGAAELPCACCHCVHCFWCPATAADMPLVESCSTLSPHVQPRRCPVRCALGGSPSVGSQSACH